MRYLGSYNVEGVAESWLKTEMSWVEVDGTGWGCVEVSSGGWSWVEVVVRFGNTQ